MQETMKSLKNLLGILLLATMGSMVSCDKTEVDNELKTDDVDPWVKAVGEAALADGKSFSMSCLIIAFTGGTGLGPAAIAAALTSAEAGISTYIKEKKETDKD